MNYPLVSVIVPTKNSARTIATCLKSVVQQTYPNIELIVVDNHSLDDTLNVARQFTDKAYTSGPERNSQRNFGAAKSRGRYQAFVDSDMELSPRVVEDCVNLAEAHPETTGIVIPEESFGEGFWAKCKHLERSFYEGISWIEAARFFPRDAFKTAGGYDESLISGEDWDLSQRMAAMGSISRVPSQIFHNEGRLKLTGSMKKKYYYALHAQKYLSKHPEQTPFKSQAGPINRYKLFFTRPDKLFHNPLIGLGMLLLKTGEFAAGAAGYARAKSI